MTTTVKTGNGYVKKETMIVVALVALVAGFLGGVVFSAFHAGSGDSSRPPASSRAPRGGTRSAPSSITPDQAQRMLALEQAVATNPGDAESWIQLGHVYFDTNEFAKAIRAYEKGLAILPDNADVLVDLGVMYRRNSQPQKAIEQFDRAIAVDPGHKKARLNKGIVLRYDLNDREGAIKAWEEVLKRDPNATAPNGQPLLEAIKGL